MCVFEEVDYKIDFDNHLTLVFQLFESQDCLILTPESGHGLLNIRECCKLDFSVFRFKNGIIVTLLI